MLAAVTMRPMDMPEDSMLEPSIRIPIFPEDDFPNEGWFTIVWFVCLEYSIFWVLGAATMIEAALPHIMPAVTGRCTGFFSLHFLSGLMEP